MVFFPCFDSSDDGSDSMSDGAHAPWRIIRTSYRPPTSASSERKQKRTRKPSFTSPSINKSQELRVESQEPANLWLLTLELSTLDSQWARLELNQHALAGTRPSTLRVCQFRHEPETCRDNTIRREQASLLAKGRPSSEPSALRCYAGTGQHRMAGRFCILLARRSSHPTPVTAVRDLIAVDIGNSRLKVGRFELHSALRSPLPEPVETLTLPIVNKTGEFDAGRFRAWCDEHVDERARLLVASVHRGATSRLMAVGRRFDRTVTTRYCASPTELPRCSAHDPCE